MCIKHARLAFDFVIRICTLVFQGNKQLEKNIAGDWKSRGKGPF